MNFKDLNKSFLPHSKFKRNLRRQTLCLCIAGITINSFAFNSVFQDKYDVNLSFDRVNIETALETISSQTGVKLAYNNKDINTKKSVSVNINTSDIEEALIAVLGPDYSFKQVDDYIAIAKVNRKAVQPSRELSQEQAIKGIIVDQNNEPLIGASVYVEGTSKGVTTDLDGNYQLNDIKKGEIVTISYIGYKTQKITYRGNNLQDFRIITMFDDSEALEEIQVVAFATQKKESIVSSISTVKPGELKVPSSNLTTALAGRMSGLISYQRSGEPGKDNAEFFIRGVTTFGYKKDPLILIDGIELTTQDLSRLNTDDIESFSIMKDATSAALYGARGANGVILVTTKQGQEGKVIFSARLENSFSTAAKKIDIADPITYMLKHNEAVRTRNPLSPLPYSERKIDNTIAGTNPFVYPTVDWYNTMFNDVVSNQRFNANVSGGGKVARYYLAASYNRDNGNLKVDKRNNFNSNIRTDQVAIRSNININLTKTTEIVVRMHGTFDDYTGPLDGGTLVFNKVMRANPVKFPAYYHADEKHTNTKHILFGNTEQGNFINPYADVVKGYKDNSRTLLLSQAELHQKLDFITEGLKARILVNTNRTSYFEVSRFYNPYYYIVDSYDRFNNIYELKNVNPNDGTEFLNYEEGGKLISSNIYLETALNYEKTFNKKHTVGALLVYTMKSGLNANSGNLQKSLAYRNLGLAGRATYAYNDKYFFEGNFGYTGSERFSKSQRFGFFPSIGLGWMVSNESFFNNLKEKITQLKLKGTYGLVGNDAIGSAEDRFFYLSQVNLADGSAPGFGQDFNKPDYRPGVSIQRYANDAITWETAKKLDIGFELGLFNDLNIQADYFREDRSNILMDRTSITPEMGLEAPVRANVGKAYSSGFDASIDYSKYFLNTLWLSGRGNFTYATGKFKVYEEPNYSDTPWLSHVNHSLSQEWGYIAERLFISDDEVANSPSQFGEYMAGDIKYRDINQDGVIDFRDRVPIGYPTSPEIIYGFGLSAGYKGLDFSMFFQGSARSSFWINPVTTAPFLDTDENGSVTSTNALLNVYANNHWSESNQNPYALWPRLSNTHIENNTQQSTWFMQNGAFLRLKSLEIGYSLPDDLIRKARMNKLRIYLNGSNLLTFSKFKLWDPEMAGNGLGYPIQRVYNIGLQLGF